MPMRTIRLETNRVLLIVCTCPIAFLYESLMNTSIYIDIVPLVLTEALYCVDDFNIWRAPPCLDPFYGL